MLRDDLLLPGAFPDLAPSSVERVETHISWVFLLDRDVFKVKKPVELGFLDFTSIERRKAACEAEVALNGRLAPEVYLGIVPVRLGTDGRCRIGGAGELVDWAVHMRRLPGDRRGDALLARGALSREHLRLVAERMARFHASARSDAETARFGLPAAIRGNVEENFRQTESSLGRYLGAPQARELLAFQRAFIEGHAELLQRRASEGRVRDGHGDLRLDQLYVLDGPAGIGLDARSGGAVTILDCIEFNDRFRFADVCADIAFLSMDLAAHRRVDLAESFLAAYARASNDFDLYALADFYESYRAYVRGKIAAIQAQDAGIAAAERRRADDWARRYFLLALSADRSSLLRPVVVAVGGIIASGKSTIAEKIGAELSAPVLDADRTRKAMLGVAPTSPVHETAWHGAYDPSFTEQVYDEVLRRAGVVLASGRPVVLDASFRSAAMRRAARELARTHGVPFRFVECRASSEVCRERLAERARRESVSDGRLAVFDAFRRSFEPVSEADEGEVVVLDTGRPEPETLRILHARIEAWPRGLVS